MTATRPPIPHAYRGTWVRITACAQMGHRVEPYSYDVVALPTGPVLYLDGDGERAIGHIADTHQPGDRIVSIQALGAELVTRSRVKDAVVAAYYWHGDAKACGALARAALRGE